MCYVCIGEFDCWINKILGYTVLAESRAIHNNF